MMKVVTRFAPSPTGYLHLGSARTALFNFLYARHFGGNFLLRIEDTDKLRSTKEATNAIIRGLDWLGIHHDSDIIYQSRRAKRHEEIVFHLVSIGKAYKCFATQEEIDVKRQEAINKAESFLFKSPWRECAEAKHPDNTPYVIRLKAPREGKTVIDDIVQGEITVSNEILDDMVLLRGDGTPTYMLAVVVDDYDMDVTHIIRGDDHLNNAFRQKVLYEAAGWKAPIMGHIPLIHGPDGAKLSKRHGAVGIEWYKDAGYLPDALFNYLLKLGWSHGDDEIISKDNATTWFDGTHLGKSASRMDFEKLKYVNAQYLRNKNDAELLEIIRADWSLKGIELDYQTESFLLQTIGELKVRSEFTRDLSELALIYHKDNIYNISSEAEAVIQKTPEIIVSLAVEMISKLEVVKKEEVQDGFKLLANERGVKLGEFMNPIRAVLTGMTSSPSVFHIIEILGKEIVLARFKNYKNKLLL